MSKFVNSNLIIAGPGPINMDEVVTFEKFQHDQTLEKDGKYQIMFIRNENSVGPKNMFWKYNKECDRDHDYTELMTAISQTLN